MGQFGGQKYGLDQQAKGADYYGLTDDDLRSAWEEHQKGTPGHLVVGYVNRRRNPSARQRLSLKRLVVEWGALGLPVWTFGRRGKIRRETERLLLELQRRFDMPLGPTVYAALTYAKELGHDLRAVLERDFGQPPKRPKRRGSAC